MYSWIRTLESYSYPVDFNDYELHNRFPNYFCKVIKGDRKSTIEFESYFREKTRRSVEAYFEVVFWKLYSLIKCNNQKVRTSTLDNMKHIVNSIEKSSIHPERLYAAIKHFVDLPNIENLQNFRGLLGLKKKNGALAIALTFPAFIDPEKYPMIDRNVALWVNANFTRHNRNRQAELSRFVFRNKSLGDNDFPNYKNWVNWCREIAQVLTEKSGRHWRARDVEMTVFTAKRKNLELNVL